MKKLLILALFTPLLVFAQDPTPPSDLDGQELRTWLRNNWYLPWHDDLGYGPAREAMFGTVDNEGGLLECVYSGFTQAASQTTFPDPINTEHTVPQSFFNGQTPMRSDIHHLFPTHQQANGTRGSLPFGEVVDQQADEWLFGSAGSYSESSNIPSSNIDAYSEIQFNVFFEPREENKGNIARAIFYFYTMYTADDLEDEFEDISAAGDLNTLYQWHVQDLPDAEEIERDEQIQGIQGNYNPYIRQPGLVATAWGFASGIYDYRMDLDFRVIQSDKTIRIEGLQENSIISLLEISGRTLREGFNSESIDVSGLAQGIYIIHVSNASGKGVKKIFLL